MHGGYASYENFFIMILINKGSTRSFPLRFVKNSHALGVRDSVNPEFDAYATDQEW